MSALRRRAYVVFGVACTHLVFGAIVRISGSGMGCGPHWPKCYGWWFPPMSRPDLVIEVMHRYLASILLLSLVALTVSAWRRRGEPGVGGRGGVLRSASLATALGFCAAVLGAVTVKLANSAPATVAHWTVAMSLVAAVTATVIRAGGMGGASAREGGASGKTRRATLAGAAMALLAVVMGGLTAKVQGGPIACLSFPLCGANPAVARGAVHVQGTHRVIALLLVLHLIGLFFALRKRRELPVLRRALAIALGLGVLQLLVAGAMIGMHLPPVLRSLHEATGVSIWIATFALAYLSRLASDGPLDGAASRRPAASGPLELEPRVAASVRVAPPGPRPGGGSASVASLAMAKHSAALPVLRASSALPVSCVNPADAATRRRVPARIELALVEPAGERADAGSPIELHAALAHAVPLVMAATLRFHGVAAADAPEPVALTSRSAMAAMRRPTMSHSIAVMVARGADS